MILRNIFVGKALVALLCTHVWTYELMYAQTSRLQSERTSWLHVSYFFYLNFFHIVYLQSNSITITSCMDCSTLSRWVSIYVCCERSQNICIEKKKPTIMVGAWFPTRASFLSLIIGEIRIKKVGTRSWPWIMTFNQGVL